MYTKIFIIGLIILITGCSTTYKRINLSDEDFINKPVVIINDVTFVEQTSKLCGPTALYMVLKSNVPELSLNEVTKITLTPAAMGSFKQDMTGAARRLGMAPYKVDSLSQIFDSLFQNLPVVIFHKTEFLGKKYWHYSVLVGYNRLSETFSMHIGPYAYYDMDISDVIGPWVEGGNWAYVVVPPSILPTYTTLGEALDNGLAFLRLGFVDAALGLSTAIGDRWPDSYEADVILAETHFKKNDKQGALNSLKRAYRKNPRNVVLKEKILELEKLN